MLFDNYSLQTPSFRLTLSKLHWRMSYPILGSPKKSGGYEGSKVPQLAKKLSNAMKIIDITLTFSNDYKRAFRSALEGQCLLRKLLFVIPKPRNETFFVPVKTMKAGETQAVAPKIQCNGETLLRLN